MKIELANGPIKKANIKKKKKNACLFNEKHSSPSYKQDISLYKQLF